MAPFEKSPLFDSAELDADIHYFVRSDSYQYLWSNLILEIPPRSLFPPFFLLSRSSSLSLSSTEIISTITIANLECLHSPRDFPGFLDELFDVGVLTLSGVFPLFRLTSSDPIPCQEQGHDSFLVFVVRLIAAYNSSRTLLSWLWLGAAMAQTQSTSETLNAGLILFQLH